MKNILHAIPKQNLEILSYIISFFVLFLSKSKENVFKCTLVKQGNT